MLVSRTFVRFFHSTTLRYAAEKSQLASLRKKTGYTFANCKKALEMHNNDLLKAENWLKEQAQALGWSKATKLEGRQTSQGLVGVAVNETNGVLVEVNCETDFVAKNKEFQKIVEEAANSCLDFARTQVDAKNTVSKLSLNAEELKNLKATDGKLLSDHLALMIGTMGENASLKRAMCVKVGNNVKLVGYAHPSGSASSNVLLGRLGGIVALKSSENEDTLAEIGKGICQHVVGMNPKRIGSEDDQPAKNKDEEDCLIHQEYLLDEGVTVRDILENNKMEVVDFSRFMCGDSVPEVGVQNLDYVETCQ